MHHKFAPCLLRMLHYSSPMMRNVLRNDSGAELDNILLTFSHDEPDSDLETRIRQQLVACARPWTLSGEEAISIADVLYQLLHRIWQADERQYYLMDEHEALLHERRLEWRRLVHDTLLTEDSFRGLLPLQQLLLSESAATCMEQILRARFRRPRPISPELLHPLLGKLASFLSDELRATLTYAWSQPTYLESKLGTLSQDFLQHLELRLPPALASQLPVEQVQLFETHLRQQAERIVNQAFHHLLHRHRSSS